MQAVAEERGRYTPRVSGEIDPALRLLRLLGHAHIIRYGIRYRLLRALFDPTKHRNKEFTVPFYGMTYRGNFANYLDWIVFFFGSYETSLLKFLSQTAKRLGPDTIFFDIGANVGHHTLYMSRHCATVHSFEPFGPVRRQLIRKLNDNAVSNVVIHDSALGDRDELKKYQVPATTNTGAGSFSNMRPDNSSREQTEILREDVIPIVRGDSYLAKHGFENVDLVKIDIEGFEVRALRGLAETLKRNRPIVVMEYEHRTIAQLSGEDELLSLFGTRYSAYRLNGPCSKYFLFESKSDSFELTLFDYKVSGTIVLVPDEKRDVIS